MLGLFTVVLALLATCQAQSENVRIVPVEGGSASEGRLEVQVDGVWGNVCDFGWNVGGARIVCNELGYYKGYAVPVTGGKYGTGGKEIVLGGTGCMGSEMSLFECMDASMSMSGPGYCFNKDDVAGVRCGLTDKDVPLTFRLRSKDDTDVTTGLFEARVEGIWKSVCGKDFSVPDAEVACRALGLSGGSLEDNSKYQYGYAGNDGFSFNDLACQGGEPDPSKCHYEQWGYCSTFKPAVISCGPPIAKKGLIKDGAEDDASDGAEDNANVGDADGTDEGGDDDDTDAGGDDEGGDDDTEEFKIGEFNFEGNSVGESNLKSMVILTDISQASSQSGQIKTWHGFSNVDQGSVVFGVFRKGSNARKWKFVQGSTYEIAAKGAFQYDLPAADYIPIEEGDVIGIIADKSQPISFKRNKCADGNSTTLRRKFKKPLSEGDEVVLRANAKIASCKKYLLGAVVEL